MLMHPRHHLSTKLLVFPPWHLPRTDSSSSRVRSSMLNSRSTISTLPEAGASPGKSLASYPVAARGVTAVALSETRLYLAGGYGTDAQGFLADAWLYDLPHDRYLPAVKLPIAATLALVRCGDHVVCARWRGSEEASHRCLLPHSRH